MPRPPFGFNVFGYISGNFGLAGAARNTISLLLHKGYPVAVRDVPLLDGRSGVDHTYDHLTIRKPWGLPYGIDLFHMNPPEINAHMALTWLLMDIEHRMNLIVPFWELPTLPPMWRDVIGLMDVVLAPSRYIEEIVRRELPGQAVLHFPQAVKLPDGIRPDRTRWGLPEGKTLFLVGFDLASDIERKNPWGAIRAFEEAFGDRDDVVLVVKLNNRHLAEVAEQAARLDLVTREHPSIRVIEKRMDYAEVLALYASCDVVLSLHRAEGLGLVPMEAMCLGKPVVATAWSGNMDFMTEENSCLVGFDMVDVNATLASYREESLRSPSRWAEPRIGEAAELMRRLAEDPGLRERIGARAAEDMRQRYAEYSEARVFEEVRRRYEEWAASPQPTARSRAIRRRRLRSHLSLVKRVPRALFRRAVRAMKR